MWVTEGIHGFSEGTMGNGGQNLYVSQKGVLQRIFQYDINGDGHPDLLFANSQSMYERPPVHVYQDVLHSPKYEELPSNGTYDGLLADLFHSGCEDLVIACQHNGTHSDVTAIIYFGNPEGLSEKYKMELPAPNATSVATGDLNGNKKMDLVFVSNGILRVFYQQERGFNPSVFTDIPVRAEAIAIADLDGDGFADLCFKAPNDRVGVLFGSPSGLSNSAPIWINDANSIEKNESGGSTAGLQASCATWKPCIMQMMGKQFLFCMEQGTAKFYHVRENRTFVCDFQVHLPTAVHAVAADLTGNGFEDLILTAFAGREQEADCRVYINQGAGIREDSFVKIPVKGAVSAAVANLNGPKILFSRLGERKQQEVPAPIFAVEEGTEIRCVGSVNCGDCMKILAGHPTGCATEDTVIVLNHKLNCMLGEENVYIYLGSKDGYHAENKIELPGHSCVEGVMCDFFDSGNVDVLLCNCFEDNIGEDDGCYIYTNDGKGVSADRLVKLPTVRAHGAAIGDFRKSGCLDIAVGGFANQELRIFHGSEKGYSIDNCTKIVLGSYTGEYCARTGTKHEDIFTGMSEEEREQLTEYGQIRWIMAADFNKDGWLDLVISEILGKRCFILWGGSEGFSTNRMSTLETDGVASAAAVDLTGNGWLDLILAQHQSTKKTARMESYVTVYWGGPEGYCENRKMQLPVTCANSVTVGDYNGNGCLDIYATSYNNGRSRDLISYLYENMDGSFSTKHVKYLFNHSGSGCVSGDFNGDGYTDLAVSCHKEYGNHVSHSFIFWGGPEGLSDERKTILPTIGPHGMSTIDPGNIMDRGEKEYYTSKAVSLPDDAVVRGMYWEGVCTSTSWVEMELRCAGNADELERAAWQKVTMGEDLTQRKLSGVIQYRLALCAKCACGTPRITRVVVDW